MTVVPHHSLHLSALDVQRGEARGADVLFVAAGRAAGAVMTAEALAPALATNREDYY